MPATASNDLLVVAAVDRDVDRGDTGVVASQNAAWPAWWRVQRMGAAQGAAEKAACQSQ